MTDEQIQKTRTFIFKNGRLLERKLWEYFFENGSKQAVLKSLLAYQNPDGGFGNGIEPDLLCPDSTAIGAEYAMHVLDLLDCYEPAVVDRLVDWIAVNVDETGAIAHPPRNLSHYPHQPWWERPDPERVLMLAGTLKKWGIDQPVFFRKVRYFYQTTDLPPVDRYYGYPHFVYLKYCSVSEEDRQKFETLIERLPVFLTHHSAHFPLLSRGWMYARDNVDENVWLREAANFIGSMQEDGGVKIPYPDLPWWRPIWTLNGCILLDQWNQPEKVLDMGPRVQ
jgi:hypothetical protein